MKPRHAKDQPTEQLEGALAYTPRHLRDDVPVESPSDASPVTSHHTRRRTSGVLGWLARPGIPTA